MCKSNLFDYATTELSHSAFFAWLLSQLDPESGSDDQVRQKALEFLNKCLERHKIPPAAEIEKITVKREEPISEPKGRFDVFVKVEEKNGRKIALIIENKLNAWESGQGQLEKYKTYIDKDLGESWDKCFIYLKAGYDFEDPLERIHVDKDGRPVNEKGTFQEKPKPNSTGFKKINWEDLYKMFGKYHDWQGPDSIIRNYGKWVDKKYHSIKKCLDLEYLRKGEEGKKLLLNKHVAQYTLISDIFKDFLGNNEPTAFFNDSGRPVIYFGNNKDIGIIFGTNYGAPWTQVWFRWFKCMGKEENERKWFFCRLQPKGNSEIALYIKLYWELNDVEWKAKDGKAKTEIVQNWQNEYWNSLETQVQSYGSIASEKLLFENRLNGNSSKPTNKEITFAKFTDPLEHREMMKNIIGFSKGYFEEVI